MVSYKIKIRGGPEQTFYTTSERIAHAKEKYAKLTSLEIYVSISNNIFLIETNGRKQANLVLDLLGLPKVFAVTKGII